MTHVRKVRGRGEATRQAAVNTRAGPGRHLCGAALVDTDFPGSDPEKPELGGVQPDATYTYLFDWAEDGSGEHTAVQTTHTWPAQKDITDFSFIVYGDNRGDDNYDFQTLHRNVACLGILRGGSIFQGGVKVDEETVYLSEYPPFILHVGDLVYEGGDALQWIPHFFRPAGTLLGRVPVFPCVGNHEDDPASNYLALFDLPDNATNTDHKERYYWFNYGDCYFVFLDTNLSFGEGSDQWNWLIGEKGKGCLTWQEFRDSRWLFIVLHCPPYTDSTDGHTWDAEPDNDVEIVRTTLTPIFESSTFQRPHRKADVVFSGHNHFYERSKYNGVHYIVTGGGGAPLHTPISPPTQGHNEGQEKAAKARHYCRIDVPASGALHLTVHEEEGTLIEELDLD